MIRVLIVDDHALFRESLAFMLKREPDVTVIGQAGTLVEVRGLLIGVDVALIDLDLRDGNGRELIRGLQYAPTSPDVCNTPGLVGFPCAAWLTRPQSGWFALTASGVLAQS